MSERYDFSQVALGLRRTPERPRQETRNPGIDFHGMRSRVRVMDGALESNAIRLSRLEARHASTPSPTVDKDRQAREEAAEDERFVRDMHILSDGSYSERQKLRREREMSSLPPEQAKAAFREDATAKIWADSMVERFGG